MTDSYISDIAERSGTLSALVAEKKTVLEELDNAKARLAKVVAVCLEKRYSFPPKNSEQTEMLAAFIGWQEKVNSLNERDKELDKKIQKVVDEVQDIMTLHASPILDYLKIYLHE